tara:strand:+ start:23748 stop:25682 length:1935 start_codon:yes stop_codon:yes gene_type:complete
MAEAMTLEQERLEIPDGGVASFVSADDEYYDSPEDRLVPEGGVTDLMQAADQLAKLGRNEDSFIVHASLGEHVIPMQVFEDNPSLKEAVFAEMREKGLEPERYIVGNELNSINPETGLPEFGFGFIKKVRRKVKKAVKGVGKAAKKAVKGIGKAVKRLGKKVVKVVKKAAPIVLPIALGMIPGVGPILAASLGSGIGSLAQGASFKDALKMALISGATAGLTKGIQGGFAARANNQTFMSGFKSGVKGAIGGPEQFTRLKEAATKLGQGQNPFSVEALRGTIEKTGVEATRPPVQFIEGAAPTSAPTTVSEAVQQGINVGPDIQAAAQQAAVPPAVPQGINVAPDIRVAAQQAQQAFTPPEGYFDMRADSGQLMTDANVDNVSQNLSSATLRPDPNALNPFPDVASDLSPEVSLKPPSGGFPSSSVDQRGYFESMEDVFKPKQTFSERLASAKQAYFPASDTRPLTERLAERLAELQKDPNFQSLSAEAQKAVVEKAAAQPAYTPNLMRTVLPSLLTAGAVAAPLGFYDAPEEEPMEPAFGGVTSDQLIAGDPGRYVPGVPVDPPAYATLQDIRVANQGGEMFPRKTGYISGPGTETSDSVPAMLSDGEFVFTAKAVRGAGNGSRRNGVRNMYQMMKNFETQAA